MAATKKSYTVVPADPTPKGPLSLSEFDQIKPWTLTPLIYVYKPTIISTADLTRTLINSLSRALVPFYPLAGRLRWIEGGRLEIDCNAMGAELVVAESESKLLDLGDFEPTPKFTQFLPNIDYTSPIHTLPIASVLVTKFACGGVTMGIAISHTVVDGTSYTHFVNLWAKLARGGGHLAEHETPSHHRFKVVPASHAPKFDHPEYKPLPMVIGRSSCEEEEAKETSVAMLKLTKDQINQLKKKANYSIEDDQKPYSTYEAVTAHIWRCACKARRGDARQATAVRLTVGCRGGRMKPPLQRGYTGNATLDTITDPACVFGDLVSKPLGYGTGKAREAIENFRDEYIVSALSFIASQEDVSVLRHSFHIVGIRTGQFLGNPNLAITSWINIPLYEADFGWGKPGYVGPSACVSDGKSYIVPGNPDDEDGSVVVALRFQTQNMNLFKKFFYKDIFEEDISSKL